MNAFPKQTLDFGAIVSNYRIARELITVHVDRHAPVSFETAITPGKKFIFVDYLFTNSINEKIVIVWITIMCKLKTSSQEATRMKQLALGVLVKKLACKSDQLYLIL